MSRLDPTQWSTDPAAGFTAPPPVESHGHQLSDVTGLTTSLGGTVPVGCVMAYFGSTAPTGWLICDGSSFSGASYPQLATLLGGTTLPDLRRAFPMGRAASGTGSTLLGTGGSKDAIAVSHNHTQNAHNHTQNAHNHTQNSHGHTQDAHAHAAAANQFVVTHNADPYRVGDSVGGTFQQVTFTTDSASATATNQATTPTNQSTTATDQNTTATNQAAGSSGTDANLPPWVAVNYIVRAA